MAVNLLQINCWSISWPVASWSLLWLLGNNSLPVCSCHLSHLHNTGGDSVMNANVMCKGVKLMQLINHVQFLRNKVLRIIPKYFVVVKLYTDFLLLSNLERRRVTGGPELCGVFRRNNFLVIFCGHMVTLDTDRVPYTLNYACPMCPLKVHLQTVLIICHDMNWTTQFILQQSRGGGAGLLSTNGYWDLIN